LSVLIVETAKQPRQAPGETLHPGIEPIFERLGVREDVIAENFHRHRGIWIDWGGPRRFDAYGADDSGPWLGFQTDRRRLNRILITAACDLGAELCEGTVPSAAIAETAAVHGIVLDQTELRAKWTIDATGRQAWLARQLALRGDRCSPPLRAQFGWTDKVDSELEGQPAITSNASGWSWIAPIGRNRQAWVQTLVSTREREAHANVGTDVSWRMHRDCAGAGYFLVGDAAAMLDPLSSHGVLRALMTGMMCVHLIGACRTGRISSADAIRHYRSWLSEQFEADVRALRALYRRHPSPDVVRAFTDTE
jgi:flavin-dependent dehydrogenase